ncbi:MAG: serpin family protein [Bacteroidetes bacterium]|nr:serpin family protein [Bacteroidota bacterium]
MKSLKFFSLALLLSIGFVSCKKSEPAAQQDPKAITLSQKDKEVIASSNDFGISLFAKTAQTETGNLMLSPLSASAALTMLLNGCNNETYDQLKTMLGYAPNLTIGEINQSYRSLISQLLDADEKVQLSIANAIFYRLGFQVKPAFLNTMATDFESQVGGLDFSAPSALTTINQWASDNTNGKIPKVIDEISPQTVMFLMNALYFKGEWTQQFDAANTSLRPFNLEDGSTIQVPTMNEEKVGALKYNGSDYTALEMPYGRKNFSMVLIVPNNNLSDFYQSFDINTWNEITSTFDQMNSWNETMVQLPKFKFDYEKKLNDQLIEMGMVDAFSPMAADLSGISDADIFVSFVKQNTFVEVNEEGTEAAAVTTIGIELTSVGPYFVVDKPFIFAIRERTTNTLLFIGGVTNPVE